MAGTQLQEPGDRKVGVMAECCSRLVHPARPAFPQNPGPLGQGQISHSDLGPPPSNKSQDSTPCTCPQANLEEAFSQRRVPLPKCV